MSLKFYLVPKIPIQITSILDCAQEMVVRHFISPEGWIYWAIFMYKPEIWALFHYFVEVLVAQWLHIEPLSKGCSMLVRLIAPKQFLHINQVATSSIYYFSQHAEL